MYNILRGLLQLPTRAIQCQPCRSKLDSKNMYDNLKFEFTEENLCRAKDLLQSYPEAERRGALLPLLDLAQRQHGWLPITAMHAVASMIKIEPFEVWEFANFYHMFNLKPVGKFLLKVCTSTPCYLRGSDTIMESCENMLGLRDGETSENMEFTLRSTYCLGACVNAPVMSINDDMYEDLNVADLERIICSLRNDVIPPAGPCGRFAAEPKLKLTSLRSDPPPAGFGMQELSKPKKAC